MQSIIHCDRIQNEQQSSQFESLSVSEINAPSSVSNEESAEQNIFYNQSEGNLVGHYNQAVDLDQTRTDQMERVPLTLQSVFEKLNDFIKSFNLWQPQVDAHLIKIDSILVKNQESIRNNTLAIMNINKRVIDLEDNQALLIEKIFGSEGCGLKSNKFIKSEQNNKKENFFEKPNLQSFNPYQAMQVCVIQMSLFSAQQRLQKLREFSEKVCIRIQKIGLKKFNAIWKIFCLKKNQFTDSFRRAIIQSYIFAGIGLAIYDDESQFTLVYHYISVAYQVINKSNLLWSQNQIQIMKIEQKHSVNTYQEIMENYGNFIQKSYKESVFTSMIMRFSNGFLSQDANKLKDILHHGNFEQYISVIPFILSMDQFLTRRCIVLSMLYLTLKDRHQQSPFQIVLSEGYPHNKHLVIQLSTDLEKLSQKKRKQIYQVHK